MNNSFIKYLIFLVFFSILLSIKGQAQVEEFPFQRDWVTYLAPNGFFLDGEGSQIASGMDSYYSYQINPYDSLAPYVSNPDYNSEIYMLKLNSDQTLAFVKKYGLPVSLDTLPFNYSGGITTVDAEGNFYVSGLTQAAEGIATEGAYQSNFSNNWSDPYEVYFPEIDTTITMPPELCKDAFIEKYNPEGEKVWGSYYNGNKDIDSGAKAIWRNGFLYIIGQTTSYEGIATPGTYIAEWGDEIGHQDYRAFLWRIDEETKAPVWGTYLNINEESSSEPPRYRFAVNSNGYAMYISNEGLKIISPNGTLSSIHSIDFSVARIHQIKTDNIGNFYVVGSAVDNDSLGTPGTFQPDKIFDWQEYIIKFNQQGEKQWGSYLFQGTSQIGVTSSQLGFYPDQKAGLYLVSLTDEENLATPGAYQEEYGGGTTDLVFFKLDAITGALQWLSYYGGEGTERGDIFGIATDNQDNLYISAMSDSPSNQIITDDALFKYPIDDRGHFVVKFINEKNLSVDEPKFSDLKLFPNPAKESITIQSDVIFSKKVKFIIYDILGRKLTKNQGSSDKTQTIDVSTLPAGTYFLKLKGKNINQTFKFVKKE